MDQVLLWALGIHQGVRHNSLCSWSGCSSAISLEMDLLSCPRWEVTWPMSRAVFLYQRSLPTPPSRICHVTMQEDWVMKTTVCFYIETIEYMITRHMWYSAKTKKNGHRCSHPFCKLPCKWLCHNFGQEVKSICPLLWVWMGFLWPVECSKSDVGKVLSKSITRPCSFPGTSALGRSPHCPSWGVRGPVKQELA